MDLAQNPLKQAELLHSQGNFVQAEQLFRLVLDSNPDHPGYRYNVAQCLQSRGMKRSAVKEYVKVIESVGDWASWRALALNNVGTLLSEIGERDMARESFEKALAVKPDLPAALNNLGNYYNHSGDYVKAKSLYEQAMGATPICHDALMNCGALNLLLGDFKTGWEQYEHRWQVPSFSTTPVKDKTKWNGEELAGKRILLTAEQGVGDAIQFIRYAPLVKAKGAAWVGYHGHTETDDLFHHTEGIDEWFIDRDPNDIDREYDYHCSLLSLPRLMGNARMTSPYINWTDGHPFPPGFNVGLVWAGNPAHAKDKLRSIDAEVLRPLLDVKGVRFYSLQYGKEGDLILDGVRDMRGELDSYTNTAGILNDLDLLISVDTSVVHLAGALMRPVWMLTPVNPDWRWMLDKPTSDWYPTLNLFRQTKEGEWSDAVDVIKRGLEVLVADH